MRALVVDQQAPGRLRMDQVPDPTPTDGQALVAVEALSLNWGEVKMLEGRADGFQPGWDAAGRIVDPGATQFPPGARVVTFGWSGAWGELRAVATGEIAQIPDSVPVAHAAALPVAGVTALRAVRELGPVDGRRIVVTGASGGVGGLAVQLAARAGASVIAIARDGGQVERLRALGAATVVAGAPDGPIFAAIDTVGGELLLALLEWVEPDATVIRVGAASTGGIRAPLAAELVGGRRVLDDWQMGGGLGKDLPELLDLVARGELDPLVGLQESWLKAGDVASRLLAREIDGKAVLLVD